MSDILQNIWSEWQIEKELGRGSYGVVYKAVRNDHNLETHAAIKVISIPANAAEIDTLRSEGLDMNATKTYLQEIVNDFVSEIRLMESLKGIQNIVSVEDYKVVEKNGELGWNIYIRMELLTPFNTFICDKKLSESEVIKLGCDICTALEVCAKRNIIHRDIKPENIFINDFGDYKLGDFGIARKLENMTGGLSQKGTFNYMAPEVANSAEYDARVDTYSLGIVLYRLLNGNRLPFLDTEKQLLNPNERKYAVERRIRGDALSAPCDASPAMANLILRACAHNPEDRFANASEMKAALMSVQNGTYKIFTLDPDATTSVRRKSQDLNSTTSVRRTEQNLDGTTSVRHAPQNYADNTPNTFGTKKKSKAPAIIAAILAVVLLAGGGFIAYPHIANILDVEQTGDVGESDDKQNDTAKYSKSDNDQIASIISEAEAVVNDDIEGAIAKIQTGLVTYPKSADLQNKLDDYTERLSAQIKADTLDKAAELADSGDYVAAMAMIETARKDSPDDADYKSAYDKYTAAHKSNLVSEALESADTLSANGDYLGALQTVNQALKSVGNDNSLTAAAKTYEDAFVKSISSQVDAYLRQEDYASAEKLLNNAITQIPNNEQIEELNQKVKNAKPVYLLNEVTPYVTPYWYEGNGIIKMSGNTYMNGFTCMGYGTSPAGNETYFNLNGNYTKLSFTAGIIENGKKGEVLFTIYADGNIIYNFTMKNNELPTDHEVDITGCKQLRIAVYDGSSMASTGSGSYGLANIMVKKSDTYTVVNNLSITLNDNEAFLLNVAEPYQTPFWYKGNDLFTMGGETYSNGFTCMGYGEAPIGNETCFNLNGIYKKLSFTAGITENSRKGEVLFTIYADGNIIYNFTMKNNELPTDHEVDITGCKQLRIAVYDGSSMASTGSGSYGLANIVVSK